MEQLIPLKDMEEERALFGPRDRWRRYLTERYGVELVSRNGSVKLYGEEGPLREARVLIDRALDCLRKGQDPTTLERIFGDPEPVRRPMSTDDVLARGIQPKSKGQQRYVESLRKNPITIAVGPAGTGKTFLAVASAVAALRRGDYRKLVLARPAVEAGERLGFLPGDLQAKVHPYLRPLYDALFTMFDPNQVQRYLETDVIEIVPLAYMRGRTLDRAFIILDEAQNTTPKQMKMFLTRMGGGSRIVVTGDATQTDLPANVESGLTHCMRILKRTAEIGVVALDRADIVRHPLVERIVRAYEKDESGEPIDPDERDSGPAAGGDDRGSRE